jgi:hypothetical protein
MEAAWVAGLVRVALSKDCVIEIACIGAIYRN